MRHLKLFLSSSCLGLCFFIAACTGKSPVFKDDKSVEGITINIRKEPVTLDWNKASDDASLTLIQNLMEGLTATDPNSSEIKIVPALAEKWDVREDGRQYTFKLRSGIKWTDGVPLQAQQFADSFERLLSSGGEGAQILYSIKNAKAFSEKKVSFSQVGVKAPDVSTLIIELDKPAVFLLLVVSDPRTFPVRKDLIEKHGEAWTQADRLVTLGPYVLKTWSHGKEIFLERNDHRVGPRAKLKSIHAVMIENPADAMKAFESGRVDVTWHVDSNVVMKFRKRGEYHEVPATSIVYLGMNLQQKPVSNPIFRRAVAMAIDREEITKMLGGGQRPIEGMIPPGIFGYESNRGMRYDPLEAQALLKRSGFKELGKYDDLEIRVDNRDQAIKVAETVQAQLKRNLGLELKIKSFEPAEYQQLLRSKDPGAFFRLVAEGAYPDPDAYLGLFSSSGSNGILKWKNRSFDDLLTKASKQTEESVRQKSYSQAQHVLVEEEIPVIPLYVNTENYLIKSHVHGFPLNRLMRRPLSGVSLK